VELLMTRAETLTHRLITIRITGTGTGTQSRPQ